MINWDSIEEPMKLIADLSKPVHSTSKIHSVKPKCTSDAIQCVLKILDAEYRKADLPSVVSSCTHIHNTKKQGQFNLLNKFKELCDGTLGIWDTPVHFDLNKGGTSYQWNPYPVTEVQLDTFKKVIDRLQSIGVLKKTKHGGE